MEPWNLPWIDPRDVSYLGRGRWRVNCIWFKDMFVQNVEVILGRDAFSFRPTDRSTLNVPGGGKI